MSIRRSRYGLALQSIGEYEEAAAHSGINVVRTKVLIFATSAIFMGMAGAIMATRRSYIDPGIAFNLETSFLPVLMAMFGGMGNLVGPVIGAVVFTALRDYLVTAFPDLFMLIFGVVLIVAILFMPNGILGVAQQAWRWIRGRIGGRQDPDGERRSSCTCLKVRESASTSAASPQCRTSTSTWTRERSSVSSGPTAPARPRCST